MHLLKLCQHFGPVLARQRSEPQMQPICIFPKKIFMPTNKHASFRYRVLNGCFQRNRSWTLDELIEEVSEQLYEAFGMRGGVSKRTIQGDLNIMKSEPPRGFNAPIVVHDGRYTYDDRSFSIENKPLTQSDLNAIREALTVLRQFRGLPQFKALADTLSRLEGQWRFPNPALIQFETNPLATGTEWIEALYKSALDGVALDITYHPFTAEAPYGLIFHPYHLREYRNRWFAFGLNEAEGRIHNLALDRIKAVEKTHRPFAPNAMFDPETYFQDLVGVTRLDGVALEDITLETTAIVSRYLETKPIHPSQQLLQRSDRSATFALRVIPNYELYAELARFGKDLSVLAPEGVRAGLQAFTFGASGGAQAE